MSNNDQPNPAPSGPVQPSALYRPKTLTELRQAMEDAEDSPSGTIDTTPPQPAPEATCTCPEFDSFGHEPGCPFLTALSAKKPAPDGRARSAREWLNEKWIKQTRVLPNGIDRPDGELLYEMDEIAAQLADRADAAECRLVEQQEQPALDTRPCTCHPDDNPPTPCPQKYAISECKAPAPDRHEASRAAFEALHDGYDHDRFFPDGKYNYPGEEGKWITWCRALDHAAQEQPAPHGSAMELLWESDVEEIGIYKFPCIRNKKGTGVILTGIPTLEVQQLAALHNESIEFLRTKLTAAERRVERLRGALELAHDRIIYHAPLDDALSDIGAALTATKEDHANG